MLKITRIVCEKAKPLAYPLLTVLPASLVRRV